MWGYHFSLSCWWKFHQNSVDDSLKKQVLTYITKQSENNSMQGIWQSLLNLDPASPVIAIYLGNASPTKYVKSQAQCFHWGVIWVTPIGNNSVYKQKCYLSIGKWLNKLCTWENCNFWAIFSCNIFKIIKRKEE